MIWTKEGSDFNPKAHHSKLLTYEKEFLCLELLDQIQYKAISCINKVQDAPELLLEGAIEAWHPSIFLWNPTGTSRPSWSIKEHESEEMQ